MKRYVNYLDSTTKVDKVIRWKTLLGDWLEVGAGSDANRTPKPLTATEAFYYYATIIVQAAAILGAKDDENKFTVLAAAIAASLNKEYLNMNTGLYCEDSQSAPAISLFTGLAPSHLRAKIFSHLVENITKTRNGHLSTGIVGSYFLYQALAQGGAPEVAYDAITANGFPGFEYMLNFQGKKQAPTTTLWEDWPGVSSLCHPVQGCVVSFFYEYLAGIRPIIEHPGFKEFEIAPKIVRDLTMVTSRIETAYGTIRSDWKIEGTKLHLRVEVPLNTIAWLKVPCLDIGLIMEGSNPLANCPGIRKCEGDKEGAKLQLGSGMYEFSMPFNTPARPMTKKRSKKL